MPEPGSLHITVPVGFDMSRLYNCTGKLYLEDGDGPIIGFRLIRPEIDISADTDFSPEPLFPEEFNPIVRMRASHVRYRIKIEGDVVAIHDGTE
jgi:hypothetical protein